MDNRKMFEFMHNCIVTASHTAYIAHDQKTFALLRDMDEIFLYFTKKPKAVTLFDELKILVKYGAIQKQKYGDRFNLRLCNEESYKSIFIQHLDVIDFFDEILERSLDKYEGELDFSFEFAIPELRTFKILLNLPHGNEEFCGRL